METHTSERRAETGRNHFVFLNVKKKNAFIYFCPGIQITNYMHLRLKDSRFWYVSIRGRGTSEIRPNVGGKKKKEKKKHGVHCPENFKSRSETKKLFYFFFFYRKKNTLSKR